MKKMPILALVVLFTFARLVRSQHMFCPAHDWMLDSNVSLTCYLPRVDYPSKCTGRVGHWVTFTRRPFTGSSSDRCTVNDVSTTPCTLSSSECSCEPANATYFILQHTFTVDSDDDGTWYCSVTCLNDNFVSPLTFTSDNCDNRVVMAYAELSSPSMTVTTPKTGSGWTVRGAVNITRIFSSTGNYSCMWSHKFNSGPYTDISSSNITFDPPVNGTAVRSGQCAFPDRPLSSDPGTYTHRVTVSPGQTVKTDSSVVIETPVITSISCIPGAGYVSEHEEVICTCDGNVGQPEGRLRWLMQSSTEAIALKDGEYGDVTLSVTQTVNRNHHNNKLRCDVDWISDISGQDFTLQVAWGPDTVSIQGDTTFYTDTTGSLTLTLTCQASQVNPTSNLTYRWNIPCDVTQQSTCRFKPRPPGPEGDGDVNKVITCTVTNVLNKNREQQDSVTLDLKYPPRSTPQISGYSSHQVLYEGDSLTLTCTVAGGDPVVNSVSLTCPGEHEQSPTNGQSSSLFISFLSDSDHNLTCVCRGHWVREDHYTLTDSRTLTVYSPVRSVQLTLNAQNSLLEVNESQSTDVVFDCTAGFARPSPDLLLSDDQGREVARLTGGSIDVTGQQSVLTHTMRNVQCENSAVYTCTADNGVDKAVSSTATLRVLCEMRIAGDNFESQEDGVPVLDASEGEGELHFQVLTTETPRTASFLFLGSDCTGPGYPPTLGLLSVTCEQTTLAYKSSCVVKVSNVTQDWAGYYSVTLATKTHDVSFTFRLQLRKEPSDDGHDTSSRRQWSEAFGTGLGVGVAVLLVYNFILIVCLWKRRWRMPCAASYHGPDETTANVESQMEMSSHVLSDAVQDTGPYEELKLSDVGQRSQYSAVGSPPSLPDVNTPETNDGYEIPRQRSARSAAAPN